MAKAHYIMIGGFLGAGKTTAIFKLAAYLTRKGRRAGLITNDQSSGLVDTAILKTSGLPVEEITGGCFCCKFNSLMEASERLTEQAKPDVFVAEPVGSCTDLRAAVNYPLRRLYGNDFEVAPLSVLIDPIRALRILGLESGRSFSPKVLYVYAKQLEEAEIIVINKADLLDTVRLSRLEEALRLAYPRAELFTVSAREDVGLEAWFDRILSAEQGMDANPDVDYDVYAEGEALLGWFNATLKLNSDRPVDGNEVLFGLARGIQQRLALTGLEIAHLKMTLVPDEDGGDIGVLNLVRTEAQLELAHAIREPLERAELIINLRGEGSPEELHQAVMEAISESVGSNGTLRIAVEHMEHFRPARPSPTYRMAGV